MSISPCSVESEERESSQGEGAGCERDTSSGLDQGSLGGLGAGSGELLVGGEVFSVHEHPHLVVLRVGAMGDSGVSHSWVEHATEDSVFMDVEVLRALVESTSLNGKESSPLILINRGISYARCPVDISVVMSQQLSDDTNSVIATVDNGLSESTSPGSVFSGTSGRGAAMKSN